jgi:hypothetical protein
MIAESSTVSLSGGEGKITVPDTAPAAEYVILGKYRCPTSRMIRLTPPDAADTTVGDFVTVPFEIRAAPGR